MSTATPDDSHSKSSAESLISIVGVQPALQTILVVAQQQVQLIPNSAELSIPTALSFVQGQLRGQPVTMQTRRFAGHGLSAFTLATISDAAGALCSVTVIALPAAGSLLPILGIDVIAFGGSLQLVALDLAPLDAGSFEVEAVPVLRHMHSLTQGQLISRKRPEFAQETFSDLALIAAARPGQEGFAAAPAVYLLQSYTTLVQQSIAQLANPTSELSQRAARAYERNQNWRLAELRNRKEHNALAQLFSPEFAHRYLHEFLFSPDA